MSESALEAIARVLDQGGEPDDVLRSVVHELVEGPGIAWAAVAFLEEGELAVGPQAGAPDESRRVRVAVTYQDARVGELWVDGEADRELLERVAALISTHVLVGWDTGGEGWEP